MSIDTLLEKLINIVLDEKASDLHLAPGYPPTIRKSNKLIQVSNIRLTPSHIDALCKTILGPQKYSDFVTNKELDTAFDFNKIVRFRVNAYFTLGKPALAMRVIPASIRSLTELNLPNIVSSLPLQGEQGLILVVGPTGHGKTTTVAAMVNLINQFHFKHIITLEDPVEYIFPPGKSLVSQREVHLDTHDFKNSLRSILREDPDVVLIGEMRDVETIEAVLTIAETGHLVFSTMHTYSAAQTIERIIQSHPKSKQDTVRMQLAYILKAIISQRLIPTKNGGLRPAVEILLNNNAIKNLIREGKITNIDNIIKTSLSEGMQPLEYSIAQLVKEGLVTQETAERYALFPEELKYWIQNV